MYPCYRKALPQPPYLFVHPACLAPSVTIRYTASTARSAHRYRSASACNCPYPGHVELPHGITTQSGGGWGVEGHKYAELPATKSTGRAYPAFSPSVNTHEPVGARLSICRIMFGLFFFCLFVCLFCCEDTGGLEFSYCSYTCIPTQMAG